MSDQTAEAVKPLRVHLERKLDYNERYALNDDRVMVPMGELETMLNRATEQDTRIEHALAIIDRDVEHLRNLDPVELKRALTGKPTKGLGHEDE